MGRLIMKSTLGTAGMGDTESTSLEAYIGAFIGEPFWLEPSLGLLSLLRQTFRDLLMNSDTGRLRDSSEDIGRFWFTQVGGGVNTDPEPFIDNEAKRQM